MSAIDQFKDAHIDLLKGTVTEYALKIDTLQIALVERDAHIEHLTEKIHNLEEELAECLRSPI